MTRHSFYLGAGALLAWYLMVAPTIDNKLNNAAPLSQWTNSGSYDNAKDCGYGQENVVKMATLVGTKPTLQAGPWTKCVADSDPGLKAK